MTTFKLASAAQIEIATEIAGIIKGTMVVDGKTARFDADEAGEIEEIATSAARYWKSLGKRAKSLAADAIRSKEAEARIAVTYARSLTN
jgi:hypothetical protein